MKETAIGRVDPRAAPTEIALDLRRVMRNYPTGVVVVASMWQGKPHGMAVNSFASVSLTPPLVMFCADRGSTTWPNLRSAGRFAVSVLAEVQSDTCRIFATKGADRFADQAWSASASGHPVLDGSIAWLDCQITDVYLAGDHDVVIGLVRSAGERPGARPLIFHGGAFTGICPGIGSATSANEGTSRWWRLRRRRS